MKLKSLRVPTIRLYLILTFPSHIAFLRNQIFNERTT